MKACMSRNAVLWTVGGGLALLLWVAALWNTGDATSEPQDSPSVETPPAPEPRSAPPPPAAPAPEPPPAEPEAEAPAAAPVVPAAAPREEEASKSPFGHMPAPEPDGPLDELRGQFESEPRSSSAHELEALAKGAFDNPNVDPRMFEEVLCRQTVCRIRMRWTSDRMISYMAALTILRTEFAPVHAVSPATRDDADGTRALEVYVRQRRPDDPPALGRAPETSPAL
jgi:hypothetical protein